MSNKELKRQQEAERDDIGVKGYILHSLRSNVGEDQYTPYPEAEVGQGHEAEIVSRPSKKGLSRNIKGQRRNLKNADQVAQLKKQAAKDLRYDRERARELFDAAKAGNKKRLAKLEEATATDWRAVNARRDKAAQKLAKQEDDAIFAEEEYVKRTFGENDDECRTLTDVDKVRAYNATVEEAMNARNIANAAWDQAKEALEQAKRAQEIAYEAQRVADAARAKAMDAETYANNADQTQMETWEMVYGDKIADGKGGK